MEFSRFLQRFNEPETLKMAKLGRELRSKGIDVVDLSLGEPDFDTPEHIKEAAIQAIRDNWTHYTPVPGFLDLREAVCEKFRRDNNLSFRPENIVVSTGAKQSLANAILALVDEDDEVIIPTPFWVTYSELVKIALGKVVAVRCDVEAGFKMTAKQLEEAITPKTKLLLFSSPCNPSGAVYSRDELQSFAAVLEKHPGVFVLSDEIYEYINYTGPHESIAQFDAIRDRVIIVNGLSKGFAMTGWRLGYIAAHPEIAKSCEKVQGQFTSGTNSVTQRAAITALTADLKPTHKMVEEFARRRRKVVQLVNDIPGWSCSEPEGAFYVFPDVSACYGKKAGETVVRNAGDLCMYLLNEAHVSTVMGDAFGEPNCIRVSFANSLENIEEGFRRIRASLARLV
jgi:aspartate aminotransferase